MLAHLVIAGDCTTDDLAYALALDPADIGHRLQWLIKHGDAISLGRKRQQYKGRAVYRATREGRSRYRALYAECRRYLRYPIEATAIPTEAAHDLAALPPIAEITKAATLARWGDWQRISIDTTSRRGITVSLWAPIDGRGERKRELRIYLVDILTDSIKAAINKAFIR